MKTIGLLVAMDKELSLFINSYPDAQKEDNFYVINYSDDIRLIIGLTGIGKVNAAITATLLIERYHPDIMISSGVCGSLDKKRINQGDIHLTSYVRYHDVWCGKPNNFGQVQGYPTNYRCLEYSDIKFFEAVIDEFGRDRNVVWGPTLSGDWFVDKVKIAEEIVTQCNLGKDTSIDMETGALAQTCHRFNVKFISVRIVSDAILNPECQKYSEFWNNAGTILNDLTKFMIDNSDKLGPFNGKDRFIQD